VAFSVHNAPITLYGLTNTTETTMFIATFNDNTDLPYTGTLKMRNMKIRERGTIFYLFVYFIMKIVQQYTYAKKD